MKCRRARGIQGVVILMLGVLLAGRAATGEELKVGDLAPQFELPGSDGKTYSLNEYRDKQVVVIAWFPKAFTGGCTKECKSFREDGAELKKLNVAYFTASVDPPETNRRFAQSLELDYPILSDEGGKVAKQYGVLNSRGVSSRHTIYVGKDGKILFIDREVKATRHAQDVIAKLKELGLR